MVEDVVCPPSLNAALKGAELLVAELAGVTFLKRDEELFGFRMRGVFKCRRHVHPDVRKGIGTRSPRWRKTATILSLHSTVGPVFAAKRDDGVGQLFRVLAHTVDERTVDLA